MAAVKRGGVVVQVGTLPHEPLPFVVNEVMAKEIDLRGAFRWGIEFDWAVDYLSTRRVDVRPLLSGQYPLKDAVAAFHAAADKNKSTKVQVVSLISQPLAVNATGSAGHIEEESCVCQRSCSPRSSRPARSPPAVLRSRSRSSSGLTCTKCREPYHTESVWAAAEIKKRTNGKFDIEVFPASTLGKETDINQGMALGTVDMIISGPSFAARSYPRLGIAYYPFIFRDGDHLIAYSKSPVFEEMVEEYREEDRHPDHGLHVLRRAAHDGAERPFTDCAGMKGLKIRVPDVPVVHGDAEGLRRESRRRSPSPRCISRCRTARSTRRRIR